MSYFLISLRSSWSPWDVKFVSYLPPRKCSLVRLILLDHHNETSMTVEVTIGRYLSVDLMMFCYFSRVLEAEVATHISRGDTLVLLADRHDIELGQRTQATVKQLRQQWQQLKQLSDRKKLLAKAYEDKLSQFRLVVLMPFAYLVRHRNFSNGMKLILVNQILS